MNDTTTSSKSKTILIILIIFSIGAAAIYFLVSNKPEAQTRPTVVKPITVDVQTLEKQNYLIQVVAGGSVAARTRSNLTAQVRGEITFVSDKFNNGGLFKQGDILLSIDNRDYQANARSARANYLQAQANYSQEQATAEQALKNWQRLGFDEEPNDLVLRKPQLEAAQAQMLSAQASYDTAKLELERTNIRAPYDGFTIRKSVDLGQYVSIGTPLGEIYADKGLEVSLALTQDNFAQLDQSSALNVELSAIFAGIEHRWPAQVARSDNIFDPTTRQIQVIAAVKDTISDKGLELKIGHYVSAAIAGREVQDVLVVPNSAIREGSYVFLFEEDRIERRDVRIVWQDENNSIIENVTENEQVVLTRLGGIISGTKAALAGAEPTGRNAEGRPQGRPQ